MVYIPLILREELHQTTFCTPTNPKILQNKKFLFPALFLILCNEVNPNYKKTAPLIDRFLIKGTLHSNYNLKCPMFKKYKKRTEERIKKQLVVKKARYLLGFKSLSRRKTSVADPDPGPGIQCLLKPLDPGFGMGKKSKSKSGMNIPHHISESLETIFCVKNI
jgi:hypothetical protein